MSVHKSRPNRVETAEPYEVHSDEWTPRQHENWDDYGADIYERLETDLGRYWYRRCWRPKKAHNGMMKRDHVKLGTPEDYIIEHVEDTFDPWGNLTGVMMRKLGTLPGDVTKDELEEAIDDIVRAKLRKLKENDPDRARDLLRQTERVAALYGVSPDE